MQMSGSWLWAKQLQSVFMFARGDSSAFYHTTCRFNTLHWVSMDTWQWNRCCYGLRSWLSSPIFRSNSDWGIAITGEVMEGAPNHRGRTWREFWNCLVRNQLPDICIHSSRLTRPKGSCVVGWKSASLLIPCLINNCLVVIWLVVIHGWSSMIGCWNHDVYGLWFMVYGLCWFVYVYGRRHLHP